MGDPRDFMDDDTEYVPGYTRKKPGYGRRRRKDKSSGIVFIIIMIFVSCLIYAVVNYWIQTLLIVGISLIILISIKWKKWRLRLLNYKISKIKNRNNFEEELRDKEERLKELNKH